MRNYLPLVIVALWFAALPVVWAATPHETPGDVTRSERSVPLAVPWDQDDHLSFNDRKIVLGPGEGKTVPVPGHSITHKVTGADTDGAYSLLEVELVGDGPPQHIHKTEDEAFYVLEGEMNVLVGERIIRATAGSFVFIPRGTVHTVSRTGQEPAKALTIFSPPGFERFFAEAVGVDVTDTEAYVAKATALAEKYNMDIVGPPIGLQYEEIRISPNLQPSDE